MSNASAISRVITLRQVPVGQDRRQTPRTGSYAGVRTSLDVPPAAGM
jgi:hypothetical protein